MESGWFELCSILSKKGKYLSLFSQKSKIISGFHSVIVQVLSSKTVFIFEDFSKASAFFIKIHFCADFPIQTIIAVGVASHKAQGQAITKTVTNAWNQ